MKIMKGNILLDTITKVDIVNAPVKQKDVDFIDYDGTLLYSYTLDEIQKMTELPPLPTQPGLICQEWNWSLEDIKAHNRRLIVGATYITDDGSTRIHINLTDDKLLEMRLMFSQTVKNGVEVNWGDGSPAETFSHTDSREVTHKYDKAGKYTISLNPINDCILQFSRDYYTYNIVGSNYTKKSKRYYSNAITSVNFGKNIIDTGMYLLSACYNVKSITLSKGITTISKASFQDCYNLRTVIIPNSVTVLKESAFEYSHGIEIVSLPNSITSIGDWGFTYSHLLEIIIPNSVLTMGKSVFSQNSRLKKVIIGSGIAEFPDYTFNDCSNLKEIIIPENIISIGNGCFYNCYELNEIVIPKNVVTIKNKAFYGCRSLQKLIIPNTVSSIGSEQVCYGLSSLKEIELPNSLIVIGNQFINGAYCLSKITIPDGVTNIGDNSFSYCYSLLEVKIPSGVTIIGARAFYNCESILKYDFSECSQIPILTDTTAFSGMPTDCKIIVPDALYDEWIAATNWSNYADYIVKTSEVYMSILEEIMPTGETFDGLGGTEEEIESVADEILGNK